MENKTIGYLKDLLGMGCPEISIEEQNALSEAIKAIEAMDSASEVWTLTQWAKLRRFEEVENRPDLGLWLVGKWRLGLVKGMGYIWKELWWLSRRRIY